MSRCAHRLAYLGLLLLAPPETASAQEARTAKQAHNQAIIIPEGTPWEKLVPPAPASAAKAWRFVEELDEVPEIALHDPLPATLSKEAAQKEIAVLVAKIRAINRPQSPSPGSSGTAWNPGYTNFPRALHKQRPDLSGLPIRIFGVDELRWIPRSNRHLPEEIDDIREKLVPTSLRGGALGGAASPEDTSAAPMPQDYGAVAYERSSPREKKPATDKLSAKDDAALDARVRAAVQILFPMHEEGRMTLVQQLLAIPHRRASEELARMAIFAPEASVRSVAIRGLKVRRERDFEVALLRGLNYPWPTAVERAADAIIALGSPRLLAQVTAFLEYEPRFDFIPTGKGKELVAQVREVVKLNHHRNCLLCHPPAKPRDDEGGRAMVGRIPSPAEPLPPPSLYYAPVDPDRTVRFDRTYLRQDFSLLLPVADPGPWPREQRFDFLVRTRTLSERETAELRAVIAVLPRSPSHRAALRALARSTGLKDVEPTREAWTEALKEWRPNFNWSAAPWAAVADTWGGLPE